MEYALLGYIILGTWFLCGLIGVGLYIRVEYVKGNDTLLEDIPWLLFIFACGVASFIYHIGVLLKPIKVFEGLSKKVLIHAKKEKK